MSDLIRRRDALLKTKARFQNRAFDWKTGCTCVHLARFHLRNLGHRVEPMPRVRSLVAAKRQLALRNCADTVDLIDQYLPRIAPAQMLLGDLAALPGEFGLSAVVIAAGNGPDKFWGFHGDAGQLVVITDIDPDNLTGCWRG